MGAFIDLSGQKFGKLLVKHRVENQGILIRWHCICECGGETIASTKKLRNGRKQSCGCLWLPAVKGAKTKHGHSANRRITTELRIWMNMRSRCNCPTTPAYENYGARGIKVCPEWDDFEVFLRDMGPRPSTEYTIDRIDNDGHYEPGNCRWATKQEQARNRRSNVIVNYGGSEMCVEDAAKLAKLNPQTVLWRIRAGWDDDRLFTPTCKG